VLGALRDYVHLWQLVPMSAIVIAWLWGGSWLLLRSLKKANYPKRIKQPRCVLIVFLAGLAGTAAGGAFFFLFETIGRITDTDMRAVGAAVGAVVLAAVSFLVIYAMLEASIKQSLAIATRPLAAVLLVTAVIGGPTAAVTAAGRRTQLERQRCQSRLMYIHSGLLSYQRVFGKPADNLQQLVEENQVDAGEAGCPTSRGGGGAYFYLPCRVVPRGETAERIVACDLAGNHKGGRNVLFANGLAVWYGRKDFDKLLKQDAQKEFAEALAAAEGE